MGNSGFIGAGAASRAHAWVLPMTETENESDVATDLTDPGARLLSTLAEIAPQSPVDVLDLADALSDTGEWSVPLVEVVDRLVAAGFLCEQENPYDGRRDVSITPEGWVVLGTEPEPPQPTFGTFGSVGG